MFRLSKTTDYGIVLMAQLASDFEGARELPPRARPAAEDAPARHTSTDPLSADDSLRTNRTPSPDRLSSHGPASDRPSSDRPAPPSLPRPRESQNARELARSADLPVPMVSKILKALAREGLLHSHRGAKGGYSLARAPEDLPVAEMIRVLEGPVALTDCAIGPALCEHETMCAVREPWQQISRVVERALADVTLADLVRGGARKHTEPGSTMLQIDRNPGASTASTQTDDPTGLALSGDPPSGLPEQASGRKPEPTLDY